MAGISALLVAPDEETDGTVSALEETDCTVTTVESATAALAELSNGAFDCIVSEYGLPGDDGLSLLQAVRETNPDVPFVMFTATGDETIASEALLNGADRYVPRNGAESLDRLQDCVTEVTEQSPAVPQQQDISGHEPAPEEIARAVEKAPIGITLSEPSLPDNPIVYCNDAWQELTGYDSSAILGRNPRMLQGPETDPEAVERIGDAIAEEQARTVEIRNYRNDGTPFWNELTVAPIYDDDGSLTQYVGFQSDITDRKSAERIANQREEKLAAERATLERVLDRVDGLLNDITRVLVAESDRTLIEDRICSEITDADGYVGSWLGQTNSAETRLQLTAGTGIQQPVNTEFELDAVPEAVTNAIDSDDARCYDASAGSSPPLGPAAIGAHRLLVVPLTYGRKRHGLLGVYAAHNDALDRRERRLFDAIGTMIASGLNAIETTRLLTTDRVTELRIVIADNQFPLSAIADRLGTDVEYIGMKQGESDTTHDLYLRTSEPVDRSPAVLTELPTVEAARIIAETPSELTVAVTVDSATPFTQLAEYGATVESATADADRTSLRLVTPPEHEIRPLLAVLESHYEGVDLRSQRDRDRRDRTPNEFASQMDARLTDRQQTALETAYLNGYFEWPRPVDGTELAETMDISRQTFHQHLRSAERKLVEGYFEQELPD